ncbi:MAG: DUF4893 domain-containing protein [Alphaproteobacteria bacterium]|nr:DUF4893 domain-containing protein [Alphaproteobacteria bacterium]MBV9371964.1 DUF4893 domain-containing protein [Alphaproteobacteria bacterium]MBV9901947.1 DUF4893 domain-containing protein [Alphaproteobacteria bacterium]
MIRLPLRRPLRLLAAPAAALLAGCQTLATPPPRPQASLVIEEPEAWRGQASPADAALIDRLPALWTAALAQARAARFSRRIAAEGELLDPSVALPRAAPAPGPYACRAVRLAVPAPRPRWEESGDFFCFVGAGPDGLSLTVDGPQRLGGYLQEEKGGARLIFLGGIAPRRGALSAYGDDPATDAVGTLERLADFRYRLTLPGRAGGLTVYEMVAAPR